MGKSTSDKSLKLETYITRRRVNPNKEDSEKKKRKDSIRKVSLILQKCETSRTPDDKRVLESFSDIARTISKRKARAQLYKERVVEKEDPAEVLERKSQRLAQVISRAKHLVCYTGAGISTSAKIPDYRGSQGIWTLLQQGKAIGQHDLSLADPTYTHMALYELHRRKMLRFVVSQNCDGLHLRAGLPKASLSEVHGNMYIEVCKTCKPNVEYWRLFDTTELTARYYHKTNRRCHICSEPLNDTIVHFGERGNLKWPLNWAGACNHSEKADVILCLGSSLKVLKKYSWLWQMDRPLKKRAKICIVNLQWTPKDKLSSLKVNGRCDEVMQLVMKYLNINVPDYTRARDPIFSHASLLCNEELHTVSQPMLKKAMKSEKEHGEEDESASEGNDTGPDNDIDADACTTSENDSRSAAEHFDSENSKTPQKTAINDPHLQQTVDVKKRTLTPLKRPIASLLKSSPVKTVPFVKTSLNSKHLLLAEAEKSSASEDGDSERESDCDNDLKSGSFVVGCKETDSIQVASVTSTKTEKGEGVDMVAAANCENHDDSPQSILAKEGQTRAGFVVAQSKLNPVKNFVDENDFDTASSLKREEIGTSPTNGCEIQYSRNLGDFSVVRTEAHAKTISKLPDSNPIEPFHGIKLNISKPLGIEESTKSPHDSKRQLDRPIESDAANLANSISSRIVEDSLQGLKCDSLKMPSVDGDGRIGSQQILNGSIASSVTNALTNAFRMLQTRSDPFNGTRGGFNGITARQLYEINAIDLAQLASSEYYRNFYEYCKAVERLPYWYDVGYAYSGLHSIIQPPPPEIDLWSSIIVPIFNMNKNEAECEFCFENYAEFKCQFYRQFSPDFAIKKYRNEKLVACECCDYSEDEEHGLAAMDDGKFESNEGDLKKCDKRSKLDVQIHKEPAKVQAGWYGKGYRKNFRKRKR